MATIEELVIKLTAESAELRAELKAAQVATEKSTAVMSKAVEGFSKDGAKSSDFFTQAWATMAGFVGGAFVTRAIDSAIGAFTGLWNTLIVDGVSAASDTQVAMNSLLGSLSRTGQVTKGVKVEFEDWATALQNTSKFGDDVVLSSAAMIQNIARLDKDALKGATQAAVDLAAAMNMDLNTAAQLVGKAVDGNVGALKRYGVVVEEGADKTQTFANVMTALNARFGGAAAAQLETYSGSMAALENQFSDFTKVFGNAVVENRSFINVINAIREVIADFTASLDQNSISLFFSQALDAAINFAAGTVAVFSPVEVALRSIIDYVQSVGVAYGAAAAAAVAAAQGNFAGAADIISSAAKEIMDDFAENRSGSDALAESLGKIKGASEAGLAATKAGLEATIEPANQAKQAVDELWNSYNAAQEAAKSFAMGVMESTVTTAEANQVQLENYQLLLDQQKISTEEYENARLELLAQKQAEEQSMLQAGLALNKASQETARASELALMNKQALERAKIEEDITKKKQAEEQARLALASQFFGNLSVLSQSGNKEIAAIGKAAAISQATIDGFAAVQKALASAPPPFNFALAASVGIATAANVAKIASTPLATGIDSVPGIGSGDNFPAMLAPGERVVPAETNQDLTKFLNNAQQGGNTINVNVVMNDVFQGDPREMGLKIISVINEAAEANDIRILGNSIT